MSAMFTKDWGAPDPISEEGVGRVEALLRTGRLHRYQGGPNHVAAAEEAFGDYVGSPYCLGVNSGGCALFLALKVAGVEPGTRVLTNSYTLAPVPGAILHAGGVPVLVDCSAETFQLDLASLRRQQEETGARHLLLCYMRGKLPDIQGVLDFCREKGVVVIEDCAHVLGSRWRGKHLGTIGLIGCFSTQTNKLINSGEGGFLVTSDRDLMAAAVIHSGSYGHYAMHSRCPEDGSLLLDQHALRPNFSLRMTPLAAVLIHEQLPRLEGKVAALNSHYGLLEARLGGLECLEFPPRRLEERHVGSSFQFRLPGRSYSQLEAFHRACKERGVRLAWFGGKEVAGFTSTHHHWSYAKGDTMVLPETSSLLPCLFDIPLYHTMSWTGADMNLVADIIIEEVTRERLQ